MDSCDPAQYLDSCYVALYECKFVPTSVGSTLDWPVSMILSEKKRHEPAPSEMQSLEPLYAILQSDLALTRHNFETTHQV